MCFERLSLFVLVFLSLGIPGNTLIAGRASNRMPSPENLADVAELADAQASGACALRGVEVRLLSSALDLNRTTVVHSLSE